MVCPYSIPSSTAPRAPDAGAPGLITLFVPRTRADLEAARALMREYAASLDIDLSYQHFESELASLPGDYAEPHGTLLVARLDEVPVGCCALRPMAPGKTGGDAEMKRLHVREACRGQGIGRRLALAIIASARERGYTRLLLDSLDTMQAAQALYASLGFRPVSPYREPAHPRARHFLLELR
ncbi:MAG: GNAT family N-acetyltransferase [Betaproteobacteria bacterium]|nr:GNAT family N-acetyltransferase [Betaproteobacteria bacterium]